MNATIERFFAGHNRPQASRKELTEAGISLRRIAAAVAAGDLRQGVTGYWLPRPADPGAAAVMRGAIADRNYNRDDE